MDHPRQELRLHPLQRARSDHRRERGRLQLAWTFSTGVNRGHEAAPLVVGSTMYVVTPFPNTLYALDLTKPGAPLKWKYEPHPAAAAQGVACCDVVNRGAAYCRRQDLSTTRSTRTPWRWTPRPGKEVWNTKVGDINKGESITMAPLVVKGKVLVGNSGGEFGVRGWLTALDAETRASSPGAPTHRPRRGRADRPALQAVLPAGPGQGPRRLDLAGRRLEDRRRRGVGLDLATTRSST